MVFTGRIRFTGIAVPLIRNPQAKLRDGRASLVLLQNDDDLFVCETVALHSLVLSMGQSLLQNGLFQRGKVRGAENCETEAGETY